MNNTIWILRYQSNVSVSFIISSGHTMIKTASNVFKCVFNSDESVWDGPSVIHPQGWCFL